MHSFPCISLPFWTAHLLEERYNRKKRDAREMEWIDQKYVKFKRLIILFENGLYDNNFRDQSGILKFPYFWNIYPHRLNPREHWPSYIKQRIEIVYEEWIVWKLYANCETQKDIRQSCRRSLKRGRALDLTKLNGQSLSTMLSPSSCHSCSTTDRIKTQSYLPTEILHLYGKKPSSNSSMHLMYLTKVHKRIVWSND